ncbi:MAG: hypothetical protein KFB95_02365 [Simkaniaceae bacterium]|nr:MAG: hypothetical protein KFB95_02365 [Simkaniaceae bacterium]
MIKFDALCHDFSMQEDDLLPLKQRLTRFDDAVKLYNDFDGQKGNIEGIKKVFQEVFNELQPGDGFEGAFRYFFQDHICHLKQSFIITKWEDCELWELANKGSQPQQPCDQGFGMHENWHQRLGVEHDESSSQKSRLRRTFKNKGWLVAAMVLGLMASYPLILKPACQAGGDLLRRMRGISVPKVQG